MSGAGWCRADRFSTPRIAAGFVCWVALALFALAAHAQLAIIPEPQHVTMEPGTFQLHDGDGIFAPADSRAQWIAKFLRDQVKAQTGVRLRITARPRDARLVLRIDPSIQGKAAYDLDVTPTGVAISARDNRGLFWGVQTFRQLLPLQRETPLTLPSVAIADAPRFPWRGVMLDVARHFYPVSFIKQQIDLMSYYKLDVFHWHLTDDEGWRIEIPRYPKLTSVGAWRIEPDGKRYGGYYTVQQIREVVAYAKARNVTVVPEIEMPGHSSAAIAAYPKLSCNGAPVTVPSAWGGFRNVDCVGKDSTFRFLDNVLDEVMHLFPSPYIHIGSDEVPPGSWSNCVACQQLAKERGLTGEEGLHGYFVNRIGKFITRHGRTMIGWDEMLEGGKLDPDAVVEVWEGKDDAAKAFANGNRIVLAAPFYLDKPTDYRTLQDLYRTDPFTEPLYTQHAQLVLGGEAALWSESATPLNADARLYPRIFAVAEHLWNPAANDWQSFQLRARAQEAWLAAQGVHYGSPDKTLVSYDVSYVPAYKRWRIRVQRGFDDMRMHYTLDGSAPTANSPAFTDVLDLYAPATVKVAPFRGDAQVEAAHIIHLIPNLAAGDPVTFATHPAWAYSGGPQRLTNGILGTRHFYDGSWDGWRGTDMDATIDLQRPTSVHAIDIRFLVAPGNWILMPRSVTCEASNDDKTWTTLQTVPLDPNPLGTSTFVKEVHCTSGMPLTARYLRVVGAQYGQPVSGLEPWIFSDQIIVH